MEVEVQDPSSGPEEDILGRDALAVVEEFIADRPPRETPRYGRSGGCARR